MAEIFFICFRSDSIDAYIQIRSHHCIFAHKCALHQHQILNLDFLPQPSAFNTSIDSSASSSPGKEFQWPGTAASCIAFVLMSFSVSVAFGRVLACIIPSNALVSASTNDNNSFLYSSAFSAQSLNISHSFFCADKLATIALRPAPVHPDKQPQILHPARGIHWLFHPQNQ